MPNFTEESLVNDEGAGHDVMEANTSSKFHENDDCSCLVHPFFKAMRKPKRQRMLNH